MLKYMYVYALVQQDYVLIRSTINPIIKYIHTYNCKVGLPFWATLHAPPVHTYILYIQIKAEDVFLTCFKPGILTS